MATKQDKERQIIYRFTNLPGGFAIEYGTGKNRTEALKNAYINIEKRMEGVEAKEEKDKEGNVKVIYSYNPKHDLDQDGDNDKDDASIAGKV